MKFQQILVLTSTSIDTGYKLSISDLRLRDKNHKNIIVIPANYSCQFITFSVFSNEKNVFFSRIEALSLTSYHFLR